MAEGQAAVDWTPPARGQRWTEDDGRAMVEALGRSGEKKAVFARRHGLNSQRILYWQSRMKSSVGGAAPAGKSSKRGMFAPVRVVEQRPSASAELLDVVVGAAVVRVPTQFDETHLQRVVRALRGASC